MSTHTEDIMNDTSFLAYPQRVLTFLEESMDEDAGTYSEEAMARIESLRSELSEQAAEAEDIPQRVWEMSAGHFEDQATAANDAVDELIAEFPYLTGLTVTREAVTIPHPTYAPGIPGTRLTAA